MKVVDVFSASKTTKISFEFSYKTLIKLMARLDTNRVFVNFKISASIII